MYHKVFVLFTGWMLLLSSATQSQSLQLSGKISSDALHRDFAVLKGVLMDYHPGLYRYRDSITIAGEFDVLERQLTRDMSLAEVYLLLSRFTAGLLCGHTFCSYYNQGGVVKDSLFNKNDKVPFTFFLFENRMFIEKDLSGTNALAAGTEVITINGRQVGIILETLIKYVKGDGGNNLKRYSDLNLSGLGKYEAFDIFFPLLFPPSGNSFSLGVLPPGSSSALNLNVQSISRAERFARMESRYGKQPATLDELWVFKLLNAETGYLKIGTFVTNKLTIDWKAFLDKAFEELNDKGIKNLIIDIRGNEGGDDEVNLVLAKKLAKRQVDFPAYRELLRYEKVAEEFRPFLNTWDKSFYNRSGQVVKTDNGFYTWKKDRGNTVVRENSKAFKGSNYLLVDAANSSATFFLTAGLQQNKLATVIGTETGGNRKGTNGGQLFFLWLPNSKIEIDIPLIGYYPLSEQPDRGLIPDVEVPLTLTDFLSGKDRVLEKALELIGK